MFSRRFPPHHKDHGQILSDNQTIQKKPNRIHTSLLGEHLDQKMDRIQTGAGGTMCSFKQLQHASEAQGETGSEPVVYPDHLQRRICSQEKQMYNTILD